MKGDHCRRGGRKLPEWCWRSGRCGACCSCYCYSWSVICVHGEGIMVGVSLNKKRASYILARMKMIIIIIPLYVCNNKVGLGPFVLLLKLSTRSLKKRKKGKIFYFNVCMNTCVLCGDVLLPSCLSHYFNLCSLY